MSGSSKDNAGLVNMADIRFLEDNKKIFTFFKFTGLFLLKQDGPRVRVSFGRLILSELMWMLWHLVGIIMALVVWKNSGESADEESSPILWFLQVFKVLMCYVFIGPIQSSILRKTMGAFPVILKLIKDLEALNFESMVKPRFKTIHSSKIILRKRDEYEAQQEMDQLNEIEKVSGKSEKISFSAKVAKKVYLTFSKLWLFIVLILGLLAFLYVCYHAVQTEEIKDEAKLVLIGFCTIFPVISTWFCIVLIEHHRNMYQVLLRMEDEAFTDKDKNVLKDIGKYVITLQALFEKLSDNIFEFTLGINFAMFTIISTTSTYEILQKMFLFLHVQDDEMEKNKFEDIVYVLPLVISILHIYLLCNRTYDLKKGGYDKVKIRFREIMMDLIMAGEDKTFKKVETIYKNIKDMKPEVEIYGGFAINYKILTAICFFSFAYASKFNKVFH